MKILFLQPHNPPKLNFLPFCYFLDARDVDVLKSSLENPLVPCFYKKVIYCENSFFAPSQPPKIQFSPPRLLFRHERRRYLKKSFSKTPWYPVFDKKVICCENYFFPPSQPSKIKFSPPMLLFRHERRRYLK